MLKNQRILVTGATGQVARPITEQLNKNNEVWAAARFSDADAKAELEAQGVHTVAFTMGDEDLSHMPDVDYVIHCGVNAMPKTSDQAIADNAEGTGFLMKRYAGAKAFFHMSSDSIYRDNADPEAVIDETAKLGGYSAYSPHYAMSKLACEGVVRFLARELKLPTVIARLDVAYGLHGHGGVPTALYQMMQAGIPYTSKNNGDSFCVPIHEDDIVNQVQGLIEHASVPATIVNLGGDEIVTVEEIIRHIESLTGLQMKIEKGDLATWQMKIVDSTKRKALAGPCEMHWKDGVRQILETRFPGSIVS
ncbi:MAG: NAD-dependent epimerase/dehydratase family protein [Halioglobus sp.]